VNCLIDALLVDVNPAKGAPLCGSSGAMPSAAEFEQGCPKKQVEFRIYLVSKGEPRKTSRSALQPPTSDQRIFRFRPMLERTSQNETRYPAQRKPGRTRPNSDEAGATPPFDAPCVTASVGLLPPQSRAARDPFGRVPESDLRSCMTPFITPRKGERRERHGDHQGNRKTTQDGTRSGS
jgi:hypothetical protein